MKELRALISKYSGLERITLSLLLLTFFSMPLSVELSPAFDIAIQIPMEPLIGLTALFSLVLLIQNRSKIRFEYTDLAVLCLIIAAWISVPNAFRSSVSAKAALVLSAYAFVFYGASRILRIHGGKAWHVFWSVLTWSYGILAAYSFVRYLQLGIHRQTSYDMALPFSDGHTLLIATGFPLLIYHADRMLRSKQFHWTNLLILPFLALIFISFSRIYWLITLMSILVLIWYHLPKMRVILIAAFLLFGAGTFTWYKVTEKKVIETKAWEDPDYHNSLFVQVQSLFDWNKNSSNSERSNRWKVAKPMIKDHLMSGVGINGYPDAYYEYKDLANIRETDLSNRRMNVHNLYLGWLSEMGLIGAFAGLMLMFAWLKNLGILWYTRIDIQALLLIANFFLLGMIEDYMLLEKIIPVFWMSLAFLVGVRQS